MPKLFVFLLLINIISIQPIFAQNQALNIDVSLAFQSGKSLGLRNGLRQPYKSKVKFDVKYNSNKSKAQLALNYDKNDNLTFDGSYIQANSQFATFGVGVIDHHWSFSDRTSLILSNNARPFESIFLKLKSELNINWLPSKANWSFEILNGNIEDESKNKNSMLLGIRAVLSPIQGLNLELLQTSQWGGSNHSNGLSAIGAAVFKDTNDNSHSNINKMAGFGVSYLISNKIMPLRVYGQAIGEDEAGSLPSCYAYLAGLEYSNTNIKYPTTLGIETVDTRIKKTTHGNCGPNTFYNNNTYQYTNYGDTMGATIDTEGTSLELFGKSQISQKINIEYSTKLLTVNDYNWSGHRLSSKRKKGLVNSLGVSWNTNDISLNGNIYHQGFSLDKAKIRSGYGISFFSSKTF